jgi:hypothetical protein
LRSVAILSYYFTPSFLFHPQGSIARKLLSPSNNSIHIGWINMVNSTSAVAFLGGNPPPPRHTTAATPAKSSPPTTLSMEPEYERLLPTSTAQQEHLLHQHILPPIPQRFGGGRDGSILSQGDHKSYSRQRTDATSPRPPPSSALLVSGATGAIIGFVLGGPLFAAMVGIGSVYAATTRTTTRRGSTTTTYPTLYENPGNDAVARVAHNNNKGAVSVSQKHHHQHHHHSSMRNGTPKRIATGAWWVKAQEWNRRHEIWQTVQKASLWSCKTVVHGIGQGLGFVWHHSSSNSSSIMAMIGKGRTTTRSSRDGVAETILYPAQIH